MRLDPPHCDVLEHKTVSASVDGPLGCSSGLEALLTDDQVALASDFATKI